MQKAFTFAVRDSLLNVGPLKDFSYGLRINADPNATGIAKQSNYELVSYNFITRTYTSFYFINIFCLEILVENQYFLVLHCGIAKLLTRY